MVFWASICLLIASSVVSSLDVESYIENIDISPMQRIPFKKLPIVLNLDSSLDDIPTENEYVRGVDDDLMPPFLKNLRRKYGNCFVSYYPIQPYLFERIISVLPPALVAFETPKIEWQIISADRLLIPHIDESRHSAINFYLVGRHEMTIFYSNATDEYRVPGINNRIFDPEWVSMYDSFTAHTGEVFALDVSEIHSVSGLVPGRPRVSISCGFQTPFEQLIQFFSD